MREIKIGTNLLKLRKEKHITQEQLAFYMGISKTAVSKWETCQSYPDITLLPILASYFDVTIDDLMSYEPRMSKEDIAKLYKRLCKDFAEKDFQTVYDECKSLVRKYRSCYPLVFNMAILYVNHAMLAGNEEVTQLMYEDACGYCHMIKEASNDLKEKQNALQIEAYCYLILNRPQEAVDALDGIQIIGSNDLLANAYYLLQDMDQALMTVEVDMYQNIMNILQSYPLFLTLHMNDRDAFEEAVQKVIDFENIYEIKKMNPGSMFSIYLVIMQGYLNFHDQKKALDYLEIYVHMLTRETTSFEIKGIGLFRHMNEWLRQQEYDIHLPREESIIRESGVDVILNNPMFDELKTEPRYMQAVQAVSQLHTFTKGGSNHE